MPDLSLTIPRDLFAAAAASVARALPKRNINPVLGNILLEGDGKDTLTLSATDGDFRLKRQLSINLPPEGQWLIPGAEIVDFAGRTKGDTLSLVQEGNQLRLTSGSAKANIAMFVNPDFPPAPARSEAAFSVEAAELHFALKSTAHMPIPPEGAGPTSWQHALNLRADGNVLSVAGGSSAAIGYCKVNIADGVQERDDFLIPHDIGKLLPDIIPDDDSEVTLGGTGGSLWLRTGSLEAFIPLLLFSRADFERLMIQTDASLTFDANAYKEALATLGLAKRWDTIGAPNLAWHAKDGKLRLAVAVSGRGEITEEIDAEIEGLPEFTFLSRLLLQQGILAPIKNGSITFRWRQPDIAGRFPQCLFVNHSLSPQWCGIIAPVVV